MRSTAFLLLVLVSFVVGCNAAPTESAKPATAMLSFSPDRYPAVHAATVEVLRQHGFRIARNDYRFGTVTTYPKESPTILEFWVDDATTYTQRREDTYNAHQRSAKIQVSDFNLDAALSGTPSAPEAQEPTYYLSIEVLVERLQRPERYLTHSASDRITAAYTAVPTHLSTRGIDGPYAQSLTRDPQLEQRLLEAIKAASQT